MVDPFVSVRGRVLINVEALNMTESVGNYVKHRSCLLYTSPSPRD